MRIRMTENPYQSSSEANTEVGIARYEGPNPLHIAILVPCIGFCATMLGFLAYGIYEIKAASDPWGVRVGAANFLAGGVCTAGPIAMFWAHIAFSYRKRWSPIGLVFAWLPILMLIAFVAWGFVARWLFQGPEVLVNRMESVCCPPISVASSPDPRDTRIFTSALFN